MNLAQTASLCILIAATATTWQPSQAQAQDQWTGSAPVFQSEVEQRERELNAPIRRAGDTLLQPLPLRHRGPREARSRCHC